jgi:hypothetical protein
MPSTRKCKGTNKEGLPCQKAAQHGENLCWSHNPDNHAERVRTASRGGRGHVNTETAFVKKLMDGLTAKVLKGEVEPATVHAVVALQNIKLRAIEVERKLEETDVRSEFEELKRELGIS